MHPNSAKMQELTFRTPLKCSYITSFLPVTVPDSLSRHENFYLINIFFKSRHIRYFFSFCFCKSRHFRQILQVFFSKSRHIHLFS